VLASQILAPHHDDTIKNDFDPARIPSGNRTREPESSAQYSQRAGL